MGGEVGSANGQNLSGYYQVKNAQIINNTFVNCDYGVRLGGGGGSKHTLPAENLMVANNIFLMPTTSSQAVNQILAAETSSPYTFTGNIRQSGKWALNGNLASNTIVSSRLLTSTPEFYRIQEGSAAIGSGTGSYTFLTKDILNGNRPSTGFDAGAEEFGSNGTHFPYNVSDAGVKLGFLSYQDLLGLEINLDTTSTEDVFCDNLTIASGSTFTIAPGHTLTVNGSLIANGNLIIQPGGSLITFNANSTTGNITIQKTISNTEFKYNYVGTPVVKNEKTTANILGSNILIYNEPTDNWNRTPSDYTLIPGQGYNSVEPQRRPYISFSGIPNDGTITVTGLTKTPYAGENSSGDGFNLVSNPYPVAIDAEAFIEKNSSIIGEFVYFLSAAAGGSMAGYSSTQKGNFSGKIEASQGFYVRVNKNNSAIIFTEDMRVTNNKSFSTESFTPREEAITESVKLPTIIEQPVYIYSDGILSVTFKSNIADVTIHDITGNIIYQKEQVSLDEPLALPMSKGEINIVKISTAKGVFTKKFSF